MYRSSDMIVVFRIRLLHFYYLRLAALDVIRAVLMVATVVGAEEVVPLLFHRQHSALLERRLRLEPQSRIVRHLIQVSGTHSVLCQSYFHLSVLLLIIMFPAERAVVRHKVYVLRFFGTGTILFQGIKITCDNHTGCPVTKYRIVHISRVVKLLS